jgi:hypothetical protein
MFLSKFVHTPMEPGHTGFTDPGGFVLEEVLSNGLGHWNDCFWPLADL